MVQHNYSFNTTKSLWEIGTGGAGHPMAEARAEKRNITSAPGAGAHRHFMPWFPYYHLLRLKKKPKQTKNQAEFRLFLRSTQEEVFFAGAVPNKPTPGRSDCTKPLWWD